VLGVDVGDAGERRRGRAVEEGAEVVGVDEVDPASPEVEGEARREPGPEPGAAGEEGRLDAGLPEGVAEGPLADVGQDLGFDAVVPAGDREAEHQTLDASDREVLDELEDP
jgi:hypothetical protein